MAVLDDKQEKGLAFIGDMMGDKYRETMRATAEADTFASDVPRMALSYAFNEAWGREGIDLKSKSMVVIAALIALRQPKELKNHVKIGVHNGLTNSDLESILVQLTPYVGFPCIASAITEVIEALREIGRDPQVQTSEEKGLL